MSDLAELERQWRTIPADQRSAPDAAKWTDSELSVMRESASVYPDPAMNKIGFAARRAMSELSGPGRQSAFESPGLAELGSLLLERGQSARQECAALVLARERYLSLRAAYHARQWR